MAHPSELVHQHGLTLIEAAVTLIVTSIALAAGVPAIGRLIAANRLTTEANALMSQLYVARSEALKRGHMAVICPTQDGANCLGKEDWPKGHMVFGDADGDRVRDPDEAVIQVHTIDDDQIQVHAGSRKTVVYQPNGSARGSNLTVTFCDSSGRVPPKAVVVSPTGRPRVAVGDPQRCG